MSWYYNIVEHIATVCTRKRYTLELNLVSWEGKLPVLDLRRWERCEDGINAMKGISFTDQEARVLRDALTKYLNEKGMQ